MQVRTTQRLTGRAMRDAILSRFGDRESVERAAAREPHGDAHDALYWLDNFNQDPAMLDETITSTTHWELTPDDVRLLTGTRLALLETVIGMDRPSVSDVQRASGRDYKRVQNDIDILERLGAVRTWREGRRRVVEAQATELTIRFA